MDKEYKSVQSRKVNFCHTIMEDNFLFSTLSLKQVKGNSLVVWAWLKSCLQVMRLTGSNMEIMLGLFTVCFHSLLIKTLTTS